MNEKYLMHWELANNLGVATPALKRAFLNLTKIEKRRMKKGDEVNPAAYMDADGELYITSNFFKLKGSNGSERMDAMMHYIIRAKELAEAIEEKFSNKDDEEC